MSGDLVLGNIPRFSMQEYTGWKGGVYVCHQTVNRTFHRHWHDHYELEYVVEGTGTHIFNGVQYPICPGTLNLLTPTDFHELIPDGTYHCVKINYRESDVDPFILNTIVGLSIGTPIFIPEGEREFFDGLFQLAVQESELYPHSPYSLPTLQKILEIILLNVINHQKYGVKNGAASQEDVSTSNERIRQILDYIHQNFRKPLDLKTVAEATHYSPTYLSRIFSRTMGTSFKTYVTNLRMNSAANLIANTDLKIIDVCHECGFNNLSNFTKDFRRIYHMTPSDYRATNKKHD